MEAKQPTQAQIKEFWEWCGLEQNNFGNWGIMSKYGGLDILTGAKEQPAIDLNNLFEYAVPKTIAFLTLKPIGCPSIIRIYKWLFERWAEELREKPNPTLALFWVIWEVIHANR